MAKSSNVESVDKKSLVLTMDEVIIVNGATNVEKENQLNKKMKRFRG